MSIFDESLHPRGQAANPGQFRSKAQHAPRALLAATIPSKESTRYTLLLNGERYAVREPGGRVEIVHGDVITGLMHV